MSVLVEPMRSRLDYRVLAVADAARDAAAAGDIGQGVALQIQAEADTVREYLYGSFAEEGPATGLVKSLEVSAAARVNVTKAAPPVVKTPPKARGSSSPPERPTLPAVAPAPVKLGLVAGVPAWWNGLSSNAKIGVGVGAVAAVALAYHMWSK